MSEKKSGISSFLSFLKTKRDEERKRRRVRARKQFGITFPEEEAKERDDTFERLKDIEERNKRLRRK